MSIAIIGGTGVELQSHPALKEVRETTIETRWGQAFVTGALLDGKRQLFFLHRHACPKSGRRAVPPHKINYRANIAALKKLGATVIFATTAVGSLRPEWPAGASVLLEQLLDFTTGRDKTFYDEMPVHIDLTNPYCPHAQKQLRHAAQTLGHRLEPGGTYLCADGPRFETAAEIALFKSWGADVIGMTGAPEAALAREAEISYAGISIVTNAAAGVLPQALAHSEVLSAMGAALPRVVDLFLQAAREYSDDTALPARNAVAEYRTADFDPIESFVLG